MVVDSLLDHQESVPLTYLQTLNVDLARDVKLLVASHWHDDHIKGLAQLYERCSAADIAFSVVMLKDEFHAYFVEQEPNGKAKSGIKEIKRISALRGGRKPPLLASAHKILWRTAGAEVEALSPSAQDLADFLQALATRQSLKRKFAEAAMPLGRNDVSVVLALRVGDESVLLGADLEQRSHQHRGWNAILNSAARHPTKSSSFKIPHHGSKNAHNSNVWTQMLTPEPLSLVAPWNRGSKLPTVADGQRILSATPRAFITNSYLQRKIKLDIAAVRNTIKESEIALTGAPLQLGHVRARKRPGETSWRVSLSGDAVHLQDFKYAS
ncbi:MAG: hypothetical protein KF779_09725 [Hyphomonadaceae bacterium]|nr:hypothetical protein [Hyphomonadaceae bacterium]